MAGPSALDEAQLATLSRARELQRKLRWARAIALGNVVSLALFAALSALLAVLDLSLPLMGLCLGGLAWNEARGRRLLLDADPRASRRLAGNQLLLLVAVLAYCAWQAYATWTGPSPLDAVLRDLPELSSALGEGALEGADAEQLNQWTRTAAVLLYGSAGLVSALVQGLTLLHYRSIRPTLEALAATPAWARAAS